MTDPARRARRLRKAELALRAVIEHGTPKDAAAHLGITESTVRRQLADYCTIYRYETVAQAAYWLDRPRKAA